MVCSGNPKRGLFREVLVMGGSLSAYVKYPERVFDVCGLLGGRLPRRQTGWSTDSGQY